MASFPSLTSIGYISPFEVGMRYKTLTSNFDDIGEEKRRRKWLYPRRDIVVQYDHISKNDTRTLWQFYMDRYGRYEAFNFFLGYTDDYEGEYVGTGDGSTLVFNSPSKSASSYVIYVDGTEKTETIDYTFGSGSGADGADTITFVIAPTSGQRITMDFGGILKIRCRFAEDNLSYQVFTHYLGTMGIKLEGLLNE